MNSPAWQNGLSDQRSTLWTIINPISTLAKVTFILPVSRIMSRFRLELVILLTRLDGVLALAG
ncbi:hypothetical protein [Marinobacter sp. V034]|uniref:hypothetical protein n=1 Tax=Marinobacter sp. V034 TaxID=3459610 RepID=UPI004044FEB5